VKSRELFGFNRNQHEKANQPPQYPTPREKKHGHWCITIKKAYAQIYDALGVILLLVLKKLKFGFKLEYLKV
jgi:hypothetical protein